ncbi:hypothetical protein ACH4RA_18595 [Streptomyces smyrnaeus]|uniref:hypothetical protein n=1 Tax=Streptomyces smyrnaeus TaxID=1387713 RepID=UPI0037B5C37C
MPTTGGLMLSNDTHHLATVIRNIAVEAGCGDQQTVSASKTAQRRSKEDCLVADINGLESVAELAQDGSCQGSNPGKERLGVLVNGCCVGFVRGGCR